MQSPKFLRNLRLLDVQRIPSNSPLRRLFVDNLPLKLLSLFLAVTIWAFVAPQRRGETTEFKFQTPLVLKNIPPDMEITADITPTVIVLVRVPRSLAKSINPNLFQVAIDLRNQLPGTFKYSLAQKNITYDNEEFPDGLEALQINPSTVTLVLEEVVRATLPVKPVVKGQTEKGIVVDWIDVDPPEVTVVGPRSIIGTMKFVPTRPLDVELLNSDVEMLAELEPAADHVRYEVPEDTIFQATIHVTFASMRVLLRDIPVIFENPTLTYKTSTETVNVHLEGPEQEVAGLNNRTVFAVIDLSQYPPGDYRGITPKVVLPERVKVLEQWPILDLFVLKRKSRES